MSFPHSLMQTFPVPANTLGVASLRLEWEAVGPRGQSSKAHGNVTLQFADKRPPVTVARFRWETVECQRVQLETLNVDPLTWDSLAAKSEPRSMPSLIDWVQTIMCEQVANEANWIMKAGQPDSALRAYSLS